MLKITLTLFFIITSIITGCDGCGIGGASWDSKKNIAEVESYKSFISPRLVESVFTNKCTGSSEETWEGISQHFYDILRTFSFSIERINRHPIELSEFHLTASFYNHRLLVKKKDKILIDELLPSVFVMHPISLGIDNLYGLPVIMVVNKSRSTTGRYFVAIYGLDGTPFYKNVLIAWQVWDINRENSHIDILGCGETRRITMKEN